MEQDTESRWEGSPQVGAGPAVAARAASAPGFGIASTPVEGMLARARASHERGALVDAERGYQDALGVDPDHAEALHLLGVVRFQQGRMDEADALMRRSIECMPSALALTNHASVLTSLGQRDEALACLDAALHINASHPRALLLRAGMLADLERHVDAATAYDRLLEKVTPPIDALCRQSGVLLLLGRHAEALASCDRALAIDGRSFEALRQRGHALRGLSRFEEAIESYGRALAIVPGNAEVLLMLGMALVEIDRLEPALAVFNDAIAMQPDLVDALYNSSVALERLGRYEQALARCERVLSLDARHAGALANRGNVLFSLERDADALDSYDEALEVAPQSCEALCNRAGALERLGRLAQALESCERAIALDETYFSAWISRGTVLQRLHKYEEALVSFDRALTIAPDDASALWQRGNTLRVMMRHEEALASYDRTLAIEPANVPAHFSKAFVFLLLANFEHGWPEYEWRWRDAQGREHRRKFAQPLWLGDEPVAGKTILLHAEQGLGDTLQFCRYARLVKALGANVVLEVQPALKSLLAKIEGVDQVVARGEPLPSFDLHCPLLSLGLVFRIDQTSIPTGIPYLRAAPTLAEKWRKRLGTPTRSRIGLVWSGNSKHLNDYNRSISLADLLPTLNDAFEWVSLQKVVRDSDQVLLEASAVRHFGDEIMDFSDTAALVQSMDLVISVDTSVAHLAGALGKRVWILLPYLPDWRWQLDREDSPWYPNARLFRQSQPGEWSDVFERVADELRSIGA
jgi:tetratricopeptide (TPR) repeat protein